MVSVLSSAKDELQAIDAEFYSLMLINQFDQDDGPTKYTLLDYSKERPQINAAVMREVPAVRFFIIFN